MKLKITIAHAHFLVRQGLISLLSEEPTIEIIEVIDDASKMIVSVAKNKPDVLILDYDAPGAFELRDIRKVREQRPEQAILIISADQKNEQIFRALEYGAIGYLTRDCDAQEIKDAIYACAQGEKFLCHKISELLFSRPNHLQDCEPSVLTAREIDIVRMVGKGLTTKEIAADLFLSHHTVNTHRKNIMKKLSLKSSAHLVLYGINTGIIILD